MKMTGQDLANCFKGARLDHPNRKGYQLEPQDNTSRKCFSTNAQGIPMKDRYGTFVPNTGTIRNK